jgi:hypothetical protein
MRGFDEAQPQSAGHQTRHQFHHALLSGIPNLAFSPWSEVEDENVILDHYKLGLRRASYGH